MSAMKREEFRCFLAGQYVLSRGIPRGTAIELYRREMESYVAGGMMTYDIFQKQNFDLNLGGDLYDRTIRKLSAENSEAQGGSTLAGPI